MLMMRSVLIVDDHGAFRSVARALLERDGFNVVGEAEDGSSAIAAAIALRPDVVLLDVQLPDTNGFDVCEQLLADPHPPIVILTSGRPSSAFRQRLSRSGASGFIPKVELVPGALLGLVGSE
jgi:DNA-binding NarL/FixJ family response regulator